MLLVFGSLRIREVRKFSAVDITATKLHKTKVILFLALAIIPIFRSIVDIVTGYAQPYAVTSAFFITCTSVCYRLYIAYSSIVIRIDAHHPRIFSRIQKLLGNSRLVDNPLYVTQFGTPIQHLR